jgi:hypothetical protein
MDSAAVIGELARIGGRVDGLLLERRAVRCGPFGTRPSW